MSEPPVGIQIQAFEFRPVFKEGETEKVWIPPYNPNPKPYETGPVLGDEDKLRRLPRQERRGFEVYLQLKNTGEKEIKKLDWGFLFLDAESGRELKKFTISSKSKIAPREVKFVSKEVLPSLFLGDKAKPEFAKGKPVVAIRHIEFADSSKWEGLRRKP
jgi:hypothetical protein